MLNNPLKYTDPTGHKACGDGEEIDCNGQSKDPKADPHPQKRNHRTREKNAKLISINFVAGVGPWFGAWSLDMVITKNEVGLFGVNMMGPGLKGEKFFPFGNLEDYKSTFMTPQIGATLYTGSLSGKTLESEYGGVKNYRGPSLNAGGSLGNGAYEYISSVDPDTGLMDRKIEGHTTGVGVGRMPAELHVMYADADYYKNASADITNLFHTMGFLE